MTAIVLGMKSMWIATGVVVGLGLAGLVAANAGDDPHRTQNVGDGIVDSPTTSSSATTTTTDGRNDVVFTSTSLDGDGPQNTPTTVRRPSVSIATTPATASATPATEPLATTTTAMVVLYNIGDPCETVGDTGQRDGFGEPLVCVAGSPNTWQRA